MKKLRDKEIARFDKLDNLGVPWSTCVLWDRLNIVEKVEKIREWIDDKDKLLEGAVKK